MAILDLQIIDPKKRTALRSWLTKNHRQSESVWIRVFKVHTPSNLIRTNDIVEECLCFGWIDSRPRKNDKDSYYLLISPRREKSVWSAINKKKIDDLLRRKLMTKWGLVKISVAKENGSWNALNKSDQLKIPVELKRAFQKNKKAGARFQKLSKSSQKVLLEWYYSAKFDATRAKRVKKIVDS